MNLFKSNPFVSALAGITLVVCGALFYLVSRAGSNYDEAKAQFDEAYAAVGVSESIDLYPTDQNRDGKRKALGEYRQSIADLRGLFDKFRAARLDNVSPQGFTDQLQSATAETTKEFASAGSELPDGFFLGFEDYRTKLAQSDATGVLGYQLGGIKHALLGLADARPSKLIRVFRQPIPEESGGNFQPAANAVSRNFAFEVTFKGSESCARKFISHLGKTDTNYYIIRCIKIVNERDTPPKVSDATFEKSAAAADATAPTPFGDFQLPEAVEAAPAGEVPAGGEAAAPAPVVEEVDTSRILAQVLGSEEIIVFVRFDLAMFLPAAELPKP